MVYVMKIYFMGSSWYSVHGFFIYSWVVHVGSTHEMLKFSWILATHANAMKFHGTYHGQFTGISCICCC